MICRQAHYVRKIAEIYIRVRSTTLATGEHIAVLHTELYRFCEANISRTSGAYRLPNEMR